MRRGGGVWLFVLLVAGAGCAPASDPRGDGTKEPSTPAPRPIGNGESRDLTLADIERLMEELSNWGRWGPTDQLGAANLVTSAKRLGAAALVTEGITVSLSHPLQTEGADDNPWPFELSMLDVPDPAIEPDFMAGVHDRYSVSYHGYSHSHLDSLCHMLYKGRLYGGVSEESITEEGCTSSSIVNLKGGIVTRGVLFDIPRLKGVRYLEPGTPIYTEDLEAWEDMAGVVVRPGDAIFIRTGRWARRAEVGPWNIAEQAAGLHASTMRWVRARDVSFLGSDAGSDVAPSQVEGVAVPVHLLAIAAMGVALFDNQDLEALAEAAAELNRWEFLLVAAPLAVEGGTGSPINAVAVF